MEKKQLNFNAPLLSVRRHSLPLCSSPENKGRKLWHDDQRWVKPVSVPFLWEQIPGKAKGGDVCPVTGFDEVPSRLKLPLGKKSGEIHEFQTHNKLSGELVIDVMDQWGKEGSEMNASFESDDDGNVSTFSQRGSFSINCSVSGLSVIDNSETKHSRTASIEARARDFLIERFLPAAKAMNLEPSHHGSRRGKRAETPPREDMMIVPSIGSDIVSDEEERAAISIETKACCFLSKSSLQLLNPLPSMKNRSKALSTKVSNLVKTTSLKSTTHKLTKYTSCGNRTHKPNPTCKSCELQIPKYTSRPIFYSGEFHTRPSYPYRTSRSPTPSSLKNDSLAIQLPLTPPLLKSPSDSWLSHKMGNAKTPTAAKWETIVRSPHFRYNHHGRYSEELVTSAPQRHGTWK